MGEAPRILIPERHKAAQTVRDYNAMDDIGGMNAAEVNLAQYEFYTAQKIGVKLMQAYPQRKWGVAVNASVGSVAVTCPSLHATHGMVIHMAGKNLHDLEVAAVRAAGEILERFGISRQRVFDPLTIENLKRDFRGDAVTADSDAGYAVKKTA
jgi:hypothetical protein